MSFGTNDQIMFCFIFFQITFLIFYDDGLNYHNILKKNNQK